MISFIKEQGLFNLTAGNHSYLMYLWPDGLLCHLAYTAKTAGARADHLAVNVPWTFFAAPNPNDKSYAYEGMTAEYPSYGSPDLREGAYQIELENGSRVSNLRYAGHTIYNGKPQLAGLPAFYASESEAETLEITLKDAAIGLSVTLFYTVFNKEGAICRSARFANESQKNIKILNAASLCITYLNYNYDFVTLSGRWANERNIEKSPLRFGSQSVSSARGASSHAQNPFVFLAEPHADEQKGEVFGFGLVYSGNFCAKADVDQLGMCRFSLGINPYDFSWLLEPGESFQTPEAVTLRSSRGFGNLSRRMHRLVRNNLMRGKWQHQERPIILNSWEAVFMDFNAEKIEAFAQEAAQLGIEMFVLDDGWFGKRNDDTTSLGDWTENKEKLPEGLKALAEKINRMGLQFGLWFEPEMVSPASALYEKHPDWIIQCENCAPSQSRNQYVLDLSRQEVQDYLEEAVSKILKNAPISYVKWDMNRNITESGSQNLPPNRQKELGCRYMLGLYSLLERLTQRFPDILFESCSGGGGRYDLGMLYYMPQTWASDNTDAIARLKIQYGTSMAYPAISMGAHVSTPGPLSIDRRAPLATRINCAYSGAFGYELNPLNLTDEEKTAVKEANAFYKQIRGLIQKGNMYRLLSPFEGQETAWMYTSEDKKEAAVFYFKPLFSAEMPAKLLKLQGLDINRHYRLEETGDIYAGDELMNIGFRLNLLESRGDYASKRLYFKGL